MGSPILTYKVLEALDDKISTYSILEALDNKREPSSEISNAISSVRDKLRSFNLLAFIIHDPEVHHGFDAKITQLFDYLDQVSGNALLFFALIDPPEEWLEHGAERPYYQSLDSLTRHLMHPGNAITSTDKGVTALSLANGLGIPSSMLPCLVVTRSLTSKNLYGSELVRSTLRHNLQR